MASGTINLTRSKASGSYIVGKIEWTSTPDISTNSSQVTVNLYVRKGDTTQTLTIATYGTWAYRLNVYGESITGNKVASVLENWVLIATKTVTGIAHEDDGSMYIDISGYVTAPTGTSFDGHTTSGGAEVDLDTIARVSVPTVSAASAQMGESITIYTNRKAASLTHTLTYTFGDATGTIATGVEEGYEWTVPDLVSKIPGKASGACTITCKTYSGAALVGSDTVALTLTIPDKSTPSASASTVKMGTIVDIYTNRKSTGFTHTLTYALGGASGTIGTGVEGGKAWIPLKSLAAYTGNKTSAACTITCDTYNGSLLVGTDSFQIILTVPDATVPKLSANIAEMGSSITITMNEAVADYTHQLSYALTAFGGNTVLATGDIGSYQGGSCQWTIPLPLAAMIPKDTKGTITIHCRTMLGETAVGTRSASLTATVPDNSTTQPKVTMTVSPVDSPFDGVFVAGRSRARISYDATSEHSLIQSYSTELLGYSSNANPYTSPVLANAGTVVITGKVTDARGYFTTQTASITVAEYSKPRVIPGDGKSRLICVRCNSDGNADPGGVYLRIQIGRKYSKVVSNGIQKNHCRLSYRWKTDAEDESGYCAPVELLAGNAGSDYVDVILPGVASSNTVAYSIQLIAEDDVGEKDTVTITVPTAFVTCHAPDGGHGFTLGGYHDPEKYDVFDCRFDAEFQGNVIGMVLGLGALPKIPGGSDFNDYKEFGAFAVETDAIAASVTNIPAAKKGTLRVWSANGCNDAENGTYILQEYICCDNSASYRRSIQLQSPEGAWEYGPWKVLIWQSI